MRRKWSVFRRFSAFERRQLLAALILLPLTTTAIRLLGFRVWRGALSTLLPDIDGRDDDSIRAEVKMITRMVGLAAARGLTRPLCLPRSLVLWFLLRRRGVDAQLQVGVRKQGPEMDAHAWVEWGGFVLNDTRNVRARFARFESFGLGHEPAVPASSHWPRA